MTLEYRTTPNPSEIEVYKSGTCIGVLQATKDRTPRYIPAIGVDQVDVFIMVDLVRKLEVMSHKKFF